MANEYPGANSEATMEGNTKDADASRIVSAIPGSRPHKAKRVSKFRRIRKIIKDK